MALLCFSFVYGLALGFCPDALPESSSTLLQGKLYILLVLSDFLGSVSSFPSNKENLNAS